MRVITTFRGKPLSEHQAGLEQICMSVHDLFIVRDGKRKDCQVLHWMLAECNIKINELAKEQLGSVIDKLTDSQRSELLMKGHVLTRSGDRSWPTPGGGATYHYEPAIRDYGCRMWFPTLQEANDHFKKVCEYEYVQRADGTFGATYAPPGCVESREYTLDRTNGGPKRGAVQRAKPLMVDWD